MARVSKTGKLISENEKLASLPKPFSEYYAYYQLGLHFSESFRVFLLNERDYIMTMFPNTSKLSFDPSEYLSPYGREEVDIHSCQQLQEFLNKLMDKGEKPADRSKIKQFDFGKIDGILEASGFKYHELTYRRIQDFWLTARRCTYPNEESQHMNTSFLDLLAAFCGYANFKEYLRNVFGEDYQADTDPTYQSLITGSAVNLQTKKIYNRKKQTETSLELVPNAITEPRTDYFLGREESLVEITEQLRQYGILLLHAEGGMGKTTVAAAYYHRSISSQTYKTLAWLYCEQGTLKAINELALFLGLPFQGLDEKDRLRMIQHKLKGMEDDFLLVLDNVEDDLGEFLMAFQGFKWKVFVTSRARMKWEGIREYKLPALSTTAAKALFKLHYRKTSGAALESGAEFEALLDKLISAIGYNTLLIEVFAKQLREEFWGGEGDRFGLSEFLVRLEAEGLYMAESQEDITTNYAFYRRKTGLATTTDILDGLHDFSKLDTHLNSLLINLALLPKGDQRLDVLHELFQPENKREFRRNLKKLYAKGWLGGDGAQVFRMSPVIQDLTINKHRERLWEEGKGLVERVGFLIQEEPHKDNFHTKFKWKPIAENLAVCFNGRSEKEFCKFLITLAILLRSIGGRRNLTVAAYSLQYVLAFEIKNFSPSSSLIVSGMSVLGVVLKDLGGRENLERALKELDNALYLSLKNVCDDLNISASIRSNISLVLKDLGGRKNLERALSELERALVLCRENLGDSAPVIATIRQNLAIILEHLSGDENLNRAKLELMKALEIGIANFGEDAPLVATIRSSYASLMQDLGGRNNILASVAELEKAIVSDIKNFGIDAPVILSRRSNLALSLKKLGGPENLNKAEVELGKALVIAIKNFGENSPQVVTIRSNLSNLLQHIGGPKNLNLALLELEKVLDLAIKISGNESPTVATLRSNLSGVLKDIGGPENIARAIEEIEKALHLGLKHFGAASLVVAKRRLTLGLILKDNGGKPNLIRSVAELDNSLAVFLLTSGPDSAIVANIRSILATVLAEIGGIDNLKRSVAEFEMSFKFMLNTHGKNASEVAVFRSNLAMALRAIGGSENLNRAKDELVKALESDLANFGAEAPSVATCRSNLALVLRDLGGYENLIRAAKELEISLASDMKNFGEEDAQTVIPRLNLALVLHDLTGKKNLLEAQKLLLTASSIADLHLGETHQVRLSVKSWLKKIEDALEKGE